MALLQWAVSSHGERRQLLNRMQVSSDRSLKQMGANRNCNGEASDACTNAAALTRRIFSAAHNQLAQLHPLQATSRLPCRNPSPGPRQWVRR